MKTNPRVLCRTFAAARAATAEERAELNKDASTSEYMPGSPYLVRWDAKMNDGTPNPVQKYHDDLYRTKKAAEAVVETYKKDKA